MKKIILSLAILFSAMSFAQYSANSPTWGDEYYDYYYDDEHYFPEDYYYEYPNDYYSDAYYRNFYRDYRRSITRVDWNRFFYEFHLSPNQIRLIIDLNNQFDTYYAWDSYYRMNPVRWYHDRFYALERILGNRLYIIFQNRYYRGIRPVVYYNNRCRSFYNVRYRVRPVYRYYNVDRYRVNRYNYHQNVGRRYGWRQNRNPHNPGGFKGHHDVNSYDGFRRNNSGYRNNTSTNRRSYRTKNATSSHRNSGFRTRTNTSNRRNVKSTNPRHRSGGFRSAPSSANRSYKNNRTSSTNRSKATSSRISNRRSSSSSSVRGGFRR